MSADILREIENQYVAEGLLEESKRKPEWTNEDDVCIVYARQTVSGIPVYPELSVMAQRLHMIRQSPVQWLLFVLHGG